jgi:hypothetical protein
MKVPAKVPAVMSTVVTISIDSRGFFQIDHSGKPSAPAAVDRPSASRKPPTNRLMEYLSERE